MVPFSFAGETFAARPTARSTGRARQALLVADLHLEKASWFARLGQFLPPYDSHATLSALATEVERTGATRLYCLGDSFHDRFGCDRLPAERPRAADLADARLDWTWIVGNHDPGFADHCGGTHRRRGRACRDHPSPRSGARRGAARNLRPFPSQAAASTCKGRSVSRRCFVASPTKIIMPAFGSLTGGLDAHHPEILRSVGVNASALVPVSDRLLRFPLAA